MSCPKCLVVAWFLAASLVYPAAADQPSESASADESIVAPEHRSLVPHRLLPLIHADQTHRELKLLDKQVRELETLFAELDGPWFRLRILPLEKQWPALDELEAKFREWSRSHFSSEQQKRIGQLELQALGSRMMLRRDVARDLALTPTQQTRFAELAKATDLAQSTLQQAVMKQEPSTALEKAALEASQAEQKAIAAELGSEQMKRMANLVGPIFDTRSLERIYPLAPEFAGGEEWINASPMSLKSLRGKVVVVHFYAFQCHNCHANFPIYRRWHDQLRQKGVVVIGIQSPETDPERDAAAVKAAAIEKQLQFPIIIDTEMKNWNAWANTMWPTVYVIDKNGYLRHWWQGELNWKGAAGDKAIERAIDSALAESSSSPLR